jgi:hypothetical protein
MFRSAAPSFLRALLMRPWVVPASRQAETPAPARTEIDPAWVASTTVPRPASAIWMSPLAADLRVAAQAADRDVAVNGGEAGHRMAPMPNACISYQY